MTIVSPMGQLRPVFTDKNGKRLSGGKVYTYEPGTLTPKATYTDALNLIPNTNPIDLDKYGEADIFLNGDYRIRVVNRHGVLIDDYDNLMAWATKRYLDLALSGFASGANKFYPTLAGANADIANITVNQVVNIGELENGGLWFKESVESTTLTKAPYDTLELAKQYSNQKQVVQEQYINDLFAAQAQNVENLINQQGVSLQQLDEYYNYLMQRIAQIAVDKGWDASFVVDASGKTQQEINTNTLNVLTFPELQPGNGDLNKLQKALDTGGYVIIAKPYTINAPLSINVENTKVWFYGAGKITTSVNTNIFNMYADNCKVLNAKLEGFGSPSTILYNGTGITLYGVKGCEVSYAKITNTGGSPIALLARNVGGTIKSCVNNVIAYNDLDCILSAKRGFDSAGILVGYSNYQAEGYSHDNNHIYANRILGKTFIDHGIAFIGHGNGNRFTQNTISDCLEYGIVVYQSPYIDNTLYDNIVSGNKINNIGHVSDNLCIKGMGIYLQKSDSTIVHGNIIDNVMLGTNNDTNLSRAGIAVGACVGVIVSDNIIENSKQFGIQFAESYGCKATNNFMDKVALDLVRITSSSKIDIIGNTGLNGGRYGVYIENFNRTTGRADYNGTSGDGINIVGNDLNCVSEGVWSSSIDAANKMIDSRIDSNLIKTPAISIYVANATNTSITSNKCKSTTNLARIQVLESDKLTVNCNTIESTAATDSGRIVLTNATNYAVEGNLFSPSNSTTTIYINGQGFKAAKKRFYGAGIPSVGTYDVGDIVWNTSPVLGGALGWICITAGSPGSWIQFGEIGGTMVSLFTTTLQSATNAINTTGKYVGKEVFNQTDSKKYYAEGNAPTSRWMRFDSGASVTPV